MVTSKLLTLLQNVLLTKKKNHSRNFTEIKKIFCKRLVVFRLTRVRTASNEIFERKRFIQDAVFVIESAQLDM